MLLALKVYFSAFSALHAEFAAVFGALTWCFHNNFHHVKVATDSLVLVRDLQHRQASEWALQTVLDDILLIICRFCNL